MANSMYQGQANHAVPKPEVKTGNSGILCASFNLRARSGGHMAKELTL
jgi:hypothetical protein